MKILLVNWQDRDNPQAGGAEIHLHEIFGRLAAKGHDVTLLCGGWPGSPPRVTLDGIQVHRVGTRYSFPALARRYYNQHLRSQPFDVLVEDINKIPLYTPRWGARHVVALVPHLFGETAFQEFSGADGGDGLVRRTAAGVRCTAACRSRRSAKAPPTISPRAEFLASRWP